MHVLAELLPKGLLQRTERISPVLIALLSSGAGPRLRAIPLLHFGESQAWCLTQHISLHCPHPHKKPAPPSQLCSNKPHGHRTEGNGLVSPGASPTPMQPVMRRLK